MSSKDGGKGIGFSMIKNSFMSGLATATSIASGTLSLNSSQHIKPAVDVETLGILDDLGMNDGRISERDLIFNAFQTIVGKCANGEENNGITIEKFVIDMLQRGFSPQWADAAYRAFDTKKNNSLNKYEYLLAVCSLKANKEVYDNPMWIKLRRRVLFAYYDRNNSGHMDMELFSELLSDLSISVEDPESFGICNKTWRRNQLNNDRNTAEHNYDDVSQLLVTTKLQMAQKQEEFEALQLEYLKLEKYSCGLKLELASTKALLDK